MEKPKDFSIYSSCLNSVNATGEYLFIRTRWNFDIYGFGRSGLGESGQALAVDLVHILHGGDPAI